MNEYDLLNELQRRYEVALGCHCVCHHVRGLKDDRACCGVSSCHVEDLKEAVKMQQAKIRNLENG